jgi:hypothetical protein
MCTHAEQKEDVKCHANARESLLFCYQSEQREVTRDVEDGEEKKITSIEE